MVRKYLILVAPILTFFIGCIGNQKAKEQQMDSHFSAKVFETADTGFGYDIYKDSSLMIHQPIIPGVSGNNGFQNKGDAEAVANLMIMKLENGVIPPSVTVKELDSLGIKSE